MAHVLFVRLSNRLYHYTKENLSCQYVIIGFRIAPLHQKDLYGIIIVGIAVPEVLNIQFRCTKESICLKLMIMLCITRQEYVKL